ncbi:TetR/AcrR family transcriptional regulator [Roseibium sp.]|uniref:TetR/AcrR family transcriptional regulator n=1 Tax=Roseibium sp. TaxID=1936156 RepID=UPI003B5187A3
MTESAKRGRPRTFDEDKTLDQILQVFWKNGYSATSLDQIAAETGLNRPSLYSAFGSKKDMFMKVVTRFADKMEAHLRDAALAEKGAKPQLKAIFSAAIDLYTGHTDIAGARYGCFAISTLPTEILQDKDFKDALEAVILRMDTQFGQLIHYHGKGNISEAAAFEAGQILAMVIHGISIRARMGEDPETLKMLAGSAVDKLVPV